MLNVDRAKLPCVAWARCRVLCMVACVQNFQQQATGAALLLQQLLINTIRLTVSDSTISAELQHGGRRRS